VVRERESGKDGVVRLSCLCCLRPTVNGVNSTLQTLGRRHLVICQKNEKKMLERERQKQADR